MRRYILFTEEELYDLLNGGETEHRLSDGEVVYFMSVDQYAKMMKTKGWYEEEE